MQGVLWPGGAARFSSPLHASLSPFLIALLAIAVIALGTRMLESHRRMYSTIAAGIFACFAVVFMLNIALGPSSRTSHPAYAGLTVMLSVAALAHMSIVVADPVDAFPAIFTSTIGIASSLVLLVAERASEPQAWQPLSRPAPRPPRVGSYQYVSSEQQPTEYATAKPQALAAIVLFVIFSLLFFGAIMHHRTEGDEAEIVGPPEPTKDLANVLALLAAVAFFYLVVRRLVGLLGARFKAIGAAMVVVTAAGLMASRFHLRALSVGLACVQLGLGVSGMFGMLRAFKASPGGVIERRFRRQWVFVE